MHPPVTTVNQNDHVAAAAYLMKRADATALIVTQAQTGEPIGIITEADISHAVADGKNPNDVRIYQLMTAYPTVVSTTASIRDAAKVMTSGRFRHLPVMGDAGLVGIVDITDVCSALLDVSEARRQQRSQHLIRRSMEHVRAVRRNPFRRSASCQLSGIDAVVRAVRSVREKAVRDTGHLAVLVLVAGRHSASVRQWFSRAYVIPCPPLLLPGLSAYRPSTSPKIIPRIFP